MQPSEKRLEQLSDEAKRTTIILKKDERNFIDFILKENKEPGIKHLFSKMLDIYRKITIYDWEFPGVYYYGISRVALVNIEIFNILIQNTPKKNLPDIGKKIGDVLKISMETTIGIDSSKQENWETVFERLSIQGFGYFSLKDKYLLIKAPFFNDPLLWKGLLKGLFDIETETKNSTAPFVFEIEIPA
ncbi:MAG: hypothetical protein LBB87_05470 [Nitrososphaerota archaeon]|jgi:hypothetical protein|nr:hypothetical protein [Nitrososphaerota archaeon]